MTTDRMPSARSLTFNVLAAIAAVGLEIVFYPAIATYVNSLFGDGNGPGSSMGYFRDVYVLPAGVVFALLSTICLMFSARSGKRRFYQVVVAIWIGNAIAVIWSSLWYFHAVRAAASAGSH